MWSNEFFPSSEYYENMSTKRLVFSGKNTRAIQGS